MFGALSDCQTTTLELPRVNRIADFDVILPVTEHVANESIELAGGRIHGDAFVTGETVGMKGPERCGSVVMRLPSFGERRRFGWRPGYCVGSSRVYPRMGVCGHKRSIGYEFVLGGKGIQARTYADENGPSCVQPLALLSTADSSGLSNWC